MHTPTRSWPLPAPVAFELVGSAVYDAETGELEHCPAELDPSAVAAYADRPAPTQAAELAELCPAHGDSRAYCGCDPT
jgi:hypothetical protein